MYIPDITERFPEGFGGVDMTDRYFPSRHRDYYDEWVMTEEMERQELEYFKKHPEELFGMEKNEDE